jgi:hypothetical protein
MSVRDVLNQANPNNTFDALRQVGLGDLANLLIKGLTATETGVVPNVTSSVAALANQPNINSLFDVNATAGTTTGHKEILLGTISGSGATAVPTPTPATGQVVWDGGKKVAFAAVDAVTAASFTYESAADTAVASCLQNQLGNRTNP